MKTICIKKKPNYFFKATFTQNKYIKIHNNPLTVLIQRKLFFQ